MNFFIMWRSIRWLLAINLILFSLWGWKYSKTSRAISAPVAAISSQSLRAIVFPGGERFIRDHHTWFLEKPLRWNINDYAVESLLANLPADAFKIDDRLYLRGDGISSWKAFLDDAVLQIALPRLQRVSIRMENQLVILEKQNSHWSLATPARAQLNFEAFSQFLHQLQSLHFDRYLGEMTSAAELNADLSPSTPLFRLELEGGRHSQQLEFHRRGAHYDLLANDHSRFEIAAESVEVLQRSLRNLRSRQILSQRPQERVDWLNEESGEHFLLQKTCGEDKLWGLLCEGGNGFELRESELVPVQEFLEALQSWHVESFEKDNPQPSDFVAFGLDSPERILTVDSHRFLLSTADSQHIYVFDGERKSIYRTALPFFWNLQAKALQSRLILDVFSNCQWQKANLSSAEESTSFSLLDEPLLLAEFQPFLAVAHVDSPANFRAKWRLKLEFRHFDGENSSVENVEILLAEILLGEELLGFLPAKTDYVLLSPSLRDALLVFFRAKAAANEKNIPPGNLAEILDEEALENSSDLSSSEKLMSPPPEPSHKARQR